MDLVKNSNKYRNLLLWWFTFSAAWGVYRLFQFPEFFSETIAKPVIWLGFTFLFFKKGFISKEAITDSQKKFRTVDPFWRVILLPAIFIILYFFIINFKQVRVPSFSVIFLLTTIIINFSTGIVEEIIYRGILYVWLLRKLDEFSAFIFLQLLFLLAHIPTLLINSESMASGFAHAFFIVLIGSVHTLIFRATKSIYASCLTHGIWNSMVYYFLLN